MTLFWYFVIYSFFGFLLEVAFARAVRAEKRDRKCFLLLPLCPVYGLGALGILGAARLTGSDPILTALLGGAAATAAEYLMSLFYEKALGVAFWDYSDLPWNLRGRVCVPFTLAWGVLALALVYAVHPLVALLTLLIPDWLAPAAVILAAADAAVSMYLLKTTGTTDSLKWYSQAA